MTEDEIKTLESAASHIRNDAYNGCMKTSLDRKYFENLADQIEDIVEKYNQSK
jgi:hypothetical protein